MKSESFKNLLFLIPALLLLALILWPFLNGVRWAFSDFLLSRPDDIQFNWGTNIINVLTPGSREFKALVNTLQFTVLTVSIQLVLGFGIAQLLTDSSRFNKIMRVVVVLPLLVPPVVAAVLWKTILTDRGVVNYLLELIGIGKLNWFGSVDMAMWSVVMIDTWIYTPFVIMICLAGLQSIPSEIVEAAKVDGTRYFTRLWYIILPLMKPFIILVVLFRGIDTLKIFDVIWATTKGGPLKSTETLHTLAYQQGVTYLDFGRSMAVLFVLWVACYLLSFFLLRKRKQEISHA
ncbi:ABC transporter permease (plasmid) [Vibrio nigripulchritudo]|uniref:carbohydrate ABC transporter permease n=1 Tax=Vibrio nigripulchritudo TaxID=28173 RepID=UPI00190C637A|nr:sugar ABC transporter permease [Vibrio nigripulchritudo]BCL73655.1 ABC transporter permease [Vibrio nigripulchritudo]BDU35024.1 ABC transporter permease [Vibrio nigripulchritudo]